MAANYCAECKLAWPAHKIEEYIGWYGRRDFRRSCAACLGELEHRPYQAPMTYEAARQCAGWAEFVRRETRREKERIKAKKPSPEELGQRDALLYSETQKAFRRDLERIKNLEEAKVALVHHRRNK